MRSSNRPERGLISLLSIVSSVSLLSLICLSPSSSFIGRVSCFQLQSSNIGGSTSNLLLHHHHYSQKSPIMTLLQLSNNDNNNNINNNDDDERNESDNGDDEAARLKKKAEDLREQIRKMEESLGDTRRPRNYDIPKSERNDDDEGPINEGGVDGISLKKKRILVIGANGRLGSQVCRYLLRNNPQTEVVACVHYVGEDSPTARGYGRLSYEVGAEDGVGSIGAAWSAEDRTATFEFDTERMGGYNLQNLRIVECELLDPVQCNTICDGVDSVIWCATDFNGNTPRAVSGLNVAFLFRALASPTKGRVEIEGLRNILGGLKNAIQEKKWQGGAGGTASTSSTSSSNQPTNVVLVSTAPDAFDDFETPYGTFNGLKREGEDIIKEEFPSLSYTILQMSRYDDNFTERDLDVQFQQQGTTTMMMKDSTSSSTSTTGTEVMEGDDVDDDKAIRERKRRRIHRSDAARAAAEALTDDELLGKTVQVWTAVK